MPTRLTRDESKALTRQKLIKAARAVFLRNGFHVSSLDEIALEAQVTKGAVYSNFANKGELFLAVLDEHIKQRVKAYQSVSSPGEDLEAVARSHAQIMLSQGIQEARWASLQAEVWACAADNPDLRKALAQRKDQMLQGMMTMIEQVAAAGNVRFALPIREVVRAGQALLRGLLLERLLGEEVLSDQQFIETFAAFVSAMVRPGTKRQEGKL